MCVCVGIVFTKKLERLLAGAEKVCHLLGINVDELCKNLVRPRIKVGHEMVFQGRNVEQVTYSISALSKALYERMFKWLVSRVNKSLDYKVSVDRVGYPAALGSSLGYCLLFLRVSTPACPLASSGSPGCGFLSSLGHTSLSWGHWITLILDAWKILNLTP